MISDGRKCRKCGDSMGCFGGSKCSKCLNQQELQLMNPRELFHQLWGQAKESHEYDKPKWMEFQKYLENTTRELEQLQGEGCEGGNHKAYEKGFAAGVEEIIKSDQLMETLLITKIKAQRDEFAQVIAELNPFYLPHCGCGYPPAGEKPGHKADCIVLKAKKALGEQVEESI